MASLFSNTAFVADMIPNHENNPWIRGKRELISCGIGTDEILSPLCEYETDREGSTLLHLTGLKQR
jgi:hypothetical protein